MSTECLNLPPVEEPKHMHCSEAPLQLPRGVDSSFPKLEESAWAAALFEKAAAPADFAVVDKVERRNEQNAVFAAGGFHPVDRGPADAAEMVKYMKSWQFQVTGKPAAAVALAEMGCEHIKSGGAASLSVEATKMIEERQLDDTFYMVDLGNVLRMYKAWRAAMPRVVPHYAVKCNPDMGMLKLLAAMGAGFDCASKGEVEMMLRLGVHPSRIIFAHPCKRPTDIRYARDHAVDLTTFDTESELHKIAAMNPRFRCVLRIRADDPEARVPLGLKYGCDTADAPRLLRLAHTLGLSVVGVSFHVGSACKNLATFSNAIESAREIFDQGLALGFPMDLLDIGGGFSGRFDAHGNVVFGEIASTINAALAAHFPPESGVRVIAEPGRYFAEAAGTLFTPVYGQRDKADLAGATKKEYFITDGLYGSFNCIIYDGQNPEFQVLRGPGLPTPKEEGDDAPLFKSTLWGPTCDSADCVYKDIMLPELRNGDWLMFPNAGAYTVAGACDFNGIAFTRPTTFYVFSDCAIDLAAGAAAGAGAAEGDAAAAAPAAAAAAAAAKEMTA